jgi:hypothetical protein
MRERWLLATALLVGAAVLTGSGLPRVHAAQAGPNEGISADLLMGRAAWYVDEFVESFSNVVSEERYLQDSSVPLPAVTPAGRGGGAVSSALLFGQARHRELKSDLLLVTLKGSTDWVPFRDVYEVDGVPVRDREARLTKLFLNPSADILEQAQRIREEGARYNLGSMRRTINNPVLALAFIQGDLQQHFAFSLGAQDPTVGRGVWIVNYKEELRPTLISGRSGFDLFAHGRLWIEADNGRVLKTEINLEQTALRGQVTTLFRLDDRFHIAVPVEMQEEYTLDTGGRVSAVAKYGRFRRFDVRTNETIGDPVRR